MFDYSDVEIYNSRKKHRARVLGLGHALYVASQLEKLMVNEQIKIRLSDIIFENLEKYYIKEGQLLYRPQGINVVNRTRVVSHVLLGLSKYAYTSL